MFNETNIISIRRLKLNTYNYYRETNLKKLVNKTKTERLNKLKSIS
jgi:hypothetical protein